MDPLQDTAGLVNQVGGAPGKMCFRKAENTAQASEECGKKGEEHPCHYHQQRRIRGRQCSKHQSWDSPTASARGKTKQISTPKSMEDPVLEQVHPKQLQPVERPHTGAGEKHEEEKLQGGTLS